MISKTYVIQDDGVKNEKKVDPRGRRDSPDFEDWDRKELAGLTREVFIFPEIAAGNLVNIYQYIPFQESLGRRETTRANFRLFTSESDIYMI